jgi:hypothetical protein
MAVEVSLVKKIRHEIAEKRMKAQEEMRNLNMSHSALSTVVNQVLRAKQKKIEQDAKKETRAIVMVVLNSFFNFWLRLPEILVFVLSSNSIFQSSDFSLLLFKKIPDFSNIMVSVSFLAYILTFSTNVLIYYFFNTKFKQLFAFSKSYVKKR